jgi:drug/metabolite transporter (DMT)-like permease
MALLAYGATVNVPQWSFGRLLGVYVALLFLVAQLIAWFAFDQRPTLPTLAGGALIVAGGLLMSFWSPS